MSITPHQLFPNDVIHRFIQFCDRPTLVIFRLVAKIFSESEELYQPLFFRRCPNLKITSPCAPTWREFYFLRCQAEYNILNRLFQIKTLYTVPAQAEKQQTYTSSQGRSLVLYEQNGSLIIQDLQEQSPLSLSLQVQSSYTLQECNLSLYLLLSTHSTITVYKLEKRLIEISRYNCTWMATSLRIIPSTDPQKFWVAATFGIRNFRDPNSAPPQLKIWSSNFPSPQTLNLPLPDLSNYERLNMMYDFVNTLVIVQSYSENETPFIILKQGDNLSIYDILTLNKCFELRRGVVPNNGLNQHMNEMDAKILQTAKAKIVMIVKEYYYWVYELPKFSNTTQILYPIFKQDQVKSGSARGWDRFIVSDFFYVRGIPSFIANNSLELASFDLRYFQIYSFSSENGIGATSKKGICPRADCIKISEHNGLPSLLFEDGKEIKTLNFNFSPSFFEKWGKTLRNMALAVLGLYLAYKVKTYWTNSSALIKMAGAPGNGPVSQACCSPSRTLREGG